MILSIFKLLEFARAFLNFIALPSGYREGLSYEFFIASSALEDVPKGVSLEDNLITVSVFPIPDFPGI
tara:strand:+ start:797 stop:1000 length:204 start_codon:yes stop_codon:yes gene_type:complete